MSASENKNSRSETTALRHVVALGASAGGLAPLIEVLRGIPAGAGLAVIVVEHLSPDLPSVLVALLQPHTPLPLIEAVDGLRIEPDRVYVITPATGLTVVHGALRVRSATDHSPRRIDDLFGSLAQDFGSRAVGVVLSGLGRDGSAGLRAIIEHGGIALAQAPETAQFDSMPRCAAAIGPAVLIAAPAQIGQRLLAAAAGTKPSAEAPADAAVTSAGMLAQMMRQVAVATGHDFSQYKTGTLERRVERRRAVHGSASLADYLSLLSASPQEADLLFKELLIGVTSFFRDPAMWVAAQQLALPALFEHAAQRPDPKLRAWVVGCSTGEEAYSLAMLLSELRDSNPAWRSVGLQVFASDLSADAIQVARLGVYPATIAANLSADRLARHFLPDKSGYRVNPALREMVLFAKHNLISDPPFSRLDLLLCRNLLIYFKSGLQQRMLALFHYLLRPGGCLLLGRAETVGRLEPLFPAIDAKLRIFGRSLHSMPNAVAAFHVEDSVTTNSPPQAAVPLQKLADRLMLEEFSPAAVLVSEEGDILYVSGRTGRYLEPAAGKANWNVHVMVRKGLRAALTSGMRQAQSRSLPVEILGLIYELDGSGHRVDLVIRPVNIDGYGRLLLILFREVLGVEGLDPPAQGSDSVVDKAKSRIWGEEMRSSHEELQSTVEELQSTIEELQTANEELTTSKEEMQAINEELQTVNGELIFKVEDLALTEGDLKNLLNSTQIATLFLDGAMNVRRFTEQTRQLISLRDVDIGRPLSDLRTTLDDSKLLGDIAQVLRTLEPSDQEIQAQGGIWYSVRIMPYRTVANVVDGVVITFADITTNKLSKSQGSGPVDA
jgi:two-component system CheB/CheR fusion protein